MDPGKTMAGIDANADGGAAGKFLAAGGEMGALMRAHDWSRSRLGPPESWPQSLRTAVSILLNSRYPMFLAWGSELAFVYNDGYRPIFGDKHPNVLGQAFADVWPEIWTDIKPLIDRALAGEPTFSEDMLLFMKRHGYSEEVYFTFSYSPIRDESGGVGGMFCACTETTGTVLGERRLRTLSALSEAAAAARIETVAATEAACLVALENNPRDIPFALLYRLDGSQPRLTGAAGNSAGCRTLDSELSEVLATSELHVLDDTSALFAEAPTSEWNDPVKSAVILPMLSREDGTAGSVLVLGINPRREFDAEYRVFFERVAGAIAAASVNAQAFEAERDRAEALAQLDRAKTTFFSNVSHEFRTPLTLMLANLEELKEATAGETDGTFAKQRQIDVIHRNGLRLLKLVNNLLDFSRIEAGRAQAVYEPVDLSAITAELASVFRSAVEKAGLQLNVTCPPLGERAYVDREMWEKIVLNLISNAFKYTLHGAIDVRIGMSDGNFEFAVHDTGTGIPSDELPKIFERFHRVDGAQGRTHEGSGIGLALVQELVRLHGGSVTARSEVDRGSTFTVVIPAGRAHLPAERLGAKRTQVSTALGTTPFIEETFRWLPDAAVADDSVYPDLVIAPAHDIESDRPRIVLADDNADMRDYLCRLLAPHYRVEAVSNGEEALAAIHREAPDLVLSDIMMPRLDGIQLLARLRSDPLTSTLPIIMLSARAGEERRIEGIEAGADDYLTKPFSTRELLARVEGLVKLARFRRESEQALRESEHRYRELVEQTPDGIFVATSKGRFVDVNDAGCAMLAMTREQVLGSVFTDILVPEEHDRIASEIARFADGGDIRSEWQMRRKDGSTFTAEIVGRRLPDGNLQGIVRDVTDQRRREDALRESEQRFRRMADNAPVMIWVTQADASCTFLSQSWYEFTGQTPETGLGFGWLEATHPEDRAASEQAFVTANDKRESFRLEYRLRRKDGEYRWAIDAAAPRFDETGQFLGYIGSVIDITERKRAEDTQRLLVNELNHRVKNTLAVVQAMAQHTMRRTSDPAEFVSSFNGRIQSLARVHSLLSTTTWQGAELRDLISDQLLHGPVAETRITAWGPAIQLQPQMALHMALVLHELGTNASKYGALSVPHGAVTISWRVEDRNLHLRWEERGGPPIRVTGKRGFGTTLIEQSAAADGGKATMSITADGVAWDVDLRLPERVEFARAVSSALPTAASRAPEEVTYRAKSSARLLAGARFLIIEDEPLVALDLAASLEEAGAEIVASAATAKDALAAIKNQAIDAALLDGNLHGSPVDEVAAALTRHKIPFAFVTGYGRETLPQCFARVAVLGKPVSTRQLLRTASELIERQPRVVPLRDQ